MSYSTVLANMQKTDRALRVCLGSAKYKKMKSLEDRAIKYQQMILEIRNFITNNQNNPTVKLLKELSPEFANGPVAKYLKDDKLNLWTALQPLQLDCQQAFMAARKLIRSVAGAQDLYGRVLAAKADFTRLHFNIEAPTLENFLDKNEQYQTRLGNAVRELDRRMAESDYRNQKDITYAEHLRNQRELFSLDLIAKNYTDVSAKTLPECEILKSTPVWKYVGVGMEPIEIRIEELNELQERFNNVEGVAELLAIIDNLRTQYTELFDKGGDGTFVEQSNGEMVATEVFGDEYDEDAELGVNAAKQRTPVSVEQVTDIVPTGRGLTAHVTQIDDAGFIPDGLAPEMLTMEQLNPYLMHADPRRDHMFAGNLTDEQMREKLLENSPKDDKDFLGAWTGGADAFVSEKAYAEGRETPELDVTKGGQMGYDPTAD